MTIFKVSARTIAARNELSTLGNAKMWKIYTNTAVSSYTIPKLLFAETPGDVLGYYEKGQNIIVLSESLIGLPSMTEVYLHELAHYVDTLINGDSAHDATFRKVCEILGVDESFSCAKVKTDIETYESRKQKIRKLLNLGSSDFQNEAESAMLKARSLMEKWDVSLSDDEDSIFGVQVTQASRKEAWIGYLGYAVSMITGAYCIFMNGCNLHFYGSRMQVEAAMYIWDELCRTVGIKCEEIVECIRKTREPDTYVFVPAGEQATLDEYAEFAEKEARYMKFRNLKANRSQIKAGIASGFQQKLRDQKSREITLRAKTNEQKLIRITSTEIQCGRKSRSEHGILFREGREIGKRMDMPSGGNRIRRIEA